jgi:hypothetical protein
MREVIQGADVDRRILPPGSMFSQKLRIVCAQCNNVWMSGMESKAKPYLMDMFRGGGRKIPLDQDAQLVLARWAFKTMAVVAQLRYSTTFPRNHCHEFYQFDRPPEHSQIWIGSASVNASEGWEQLVEFHHELTPVNVTVKGSTIPVPVYQTRFRLINVVFEAVGFPLTPPRGLGLQADRIGQLRFALLPIWPSKFPIIWWPPAESLDAIGGLRGLFGTKFIGPIAEPPGI